MREEGRKEKKGAWGLLIGLAEGRRGQTGQTEGGNRTARVNLSGAHIRKPRVTMGDSVHLTVCAADFGWKTYV